MPQPLQAEDTRCPARRPGGQPCAGGLWRTMDGADNLSEHLGRIVVQCNRCGARYSLITIPKGTEVA